MTPTLRARLALLLAAPFLAVGAISCGGDDGGGPDIGVPRTFSDLCVNSQSVCGTPFTCIDSVSGWRCTLACTKDTDCPKWLSTGPCPGPFQSPCEEGVCQPHFCE